MAERALRAPFVPPSGGALAPMNGLIGLQAIQAADHSGGQFGLSALLLCSLVSELASPLPQKKTLWLGDLGFVPWVLNEFEFENSEFKIEK